MKANATIRIARAGLAEEDELSEEVLSGGEEFLCSVFCPSGVHNGQAKQKWFCSSNSEMDTELTN